MWPCWFNSSQMAVLLRSMSLQGWWPFFLCFQQEQVTQVAGPCYHHGENLCLPSLFIWSRKNSLRTALALGFLFWQKSTANFNCTVLRSIVTESNRMNYKNVMNIFFFYFTHKVKTINWNRFTKSMWQSPEQWKDQWPDWFVWSQSVEGPICAAIGTDLEILQDVLV